jgi:hypothetical protein
MDKNDQKVILNSQNDKKRLLKDQVKKIFISQNLDTQRQLIRAISAELKISVLDCAAAITYLNEADPITTCLAAKPQQVPVYKPLSNIVQPIIKLIRYRLDLGVQHNATVDSLKQVLVEESGVDIKNIANVRIQESYTLIDLPDEMPQEIFHHLKTVEINGQKLDIRRVKARNKKRNNRRYQHASTTNPIHAHDKTSQ